MKISLSQLPCGLVTTGPTSWSGIIHLPTIKPSNSASLPSEPGKINTVNAVVEIGFDDTGLTFDKAVRLQFSGLAGNRVGHIHSNSFTEIISACTDDSQNTNNGLASGGDCKINVGADLIIWTKHFTQFVVFTSSSTGTSGQASQGGTASGGGGGPLVPEKQIHGIPLKIKFYAKRWSEGIADASYFVQAIQYLINEGIIQYEPGTGNVKHIPSWVKHPAAWWADDQISDKEFVVGMQYLINNKILIL